MDLDPERRAVKPRAAASIVLVRRDVSRDSLEVFMLRRHHRASFMSSAFVFPGGTADPGETDLRTVAARELLEEAGVLLCAEDAQASVLDEIRRALVNGGQSFSSLLASAGVELALDALVPFAQWITPSAEPKRFSAHFFLAPMPSGQSPAFDNIETVDQLWVSPSQALSKAGELRLPPPQIHTLMLIDELSKGDTARLFEAARRRKNSIEPILPRLAPPSDGTGVTLLLPWDPDYDSKGTGEALRMSPENPVACGPSRFVMRDRTWSLESP